VQLRGLQALLFLLCLGHFVNDILPADIQILLTICLESLWDFSRHITHIPFKGGVCLKCRDKVFSYLPSISLRRSYVQTFVLHLVERFSFWLFFYFFLSCSLCFCDSSSISVSHKQLMIFAIQSAWVPWEQLGIHCLSKNIYKSIKILLSFQKYI